MAAPTVITITDGHLTLADTEAELASGGEEFSCQVTEAAINATPNLQTVPATFCEPESQSPAATGYELAVTWLQDWTAPGGGLSNYAFENDTQTKWFSLKLNAEDDPIAVGQVRLVAGAFGGPAGTPLTTSTTWPLASKPAIGVPDSVADPNDLSSTYPSAAAQPDLATLQADPTDGDGIFAGGEFTTGQYITLGDASQANYQGNAWTAGPAA